MEINDVREQSRGRVRPVQSSRHHSKPGWMMYVVAICIAAGLKLEAGPITVFSLPFTLTNQSADGFAAPSGDGLTLVLTGGNTGSGLPGTTDLTTTALDASLIAFNFSYSTLDARDFDSAGYLVDGTFTQLAGMDGISGSSSFSVLAGQTFGFRVATVDNEGEPGILTVSNFTSGTPEPGSLVLGLTGLALLALGYRRGHGSNSGASRHNDFAKKRRTGSSREGLHHG